jgi:hypothetical protein
MKLIKNIKDCLGPTSTALPDPKPAPEAAPAEAPVKKEPLVVPELLLAKLLRYHAERECAQAKLVAQKLSRDAYIAKIDQELNQLHADVKQAQENNQKVIKEIEEVLHVSLPDYVIDRNTGVLTPASAAKE